MEMGQALIARLGPGSATEAKVGNRVHWNLRPQGAPLPALVLTVVSEDRPQNLKGAEDMRVARVQASGFADDYGEARLIVEAAIADLLPVAEVTDPAGADVLFWRAGVEGPRDLGVDYVAGAPVHHVQADLILRYAKV